MEFACEEYSDELIEECKPLFKAHYQEIEKFQDIPLEPNYSQYKSARNQKILKIFTAREHGVVIGYSFFFVLNSPHYKNSRQAVQDLVFVYKHSRKGFVGIRFIKWCDKQLRKDGVQVIFRQVTPQNNFGKILMRQGYQLHEALYAKRTDN